MDKLYLMLQSSENPKSLKKANYKFTDEVNDRVKGTLDFLSENSISNEEYEKIISQLKRMSKQQRDNYMIDLMYGVLTNETSVSSQTRPGNFDTLKKDAFIFDILENVPNKKIFELIKQKFQNKSDSEILNNLFDYLQKFTDKELEKLAEQYKRFNNLLSPTSQLYFHNQNMAGLTLVGIYANGTSHHALMQDQGLMLSDNVDITINGHKAKYFDKVKDFYGNLISTNLAEPQAASVDNIKNPVLARLNQNRFTANIMPTLLRLGYSLHDINLFLKQPSIVRITTSYLRGDGQIDTIIEEVRQEYQDYNKGLPDISKTETEFSDNFLAKQLLIAKDDKIVNNNVSYVKMYDKDGNYIGEMEDDESAQNSLKHLSPDYENYEDVISYYKNQIAIIDMFKEVYKASNAMTNLVQCTRSDTQSGGAGPMIADTESKIYKWEQILDDPTFCIKLANDDISQLQKTDMLNQYNSDNENDELRFNLYNSKLPFLQAFYTFGLEGSRMMFGKYFPLLQKPFIQMVKQMQQLTKYNIDSDTLKDLYDAFFDYCATSTNFFGEHQIEDIEKRQYFIRNFPDDFKKMVKTIPELEKNEFIQRLKVNFVDNTYKNVAGIGGYSNIKVIQFRNVGQLTAFQKDKYIRYWEDMLYRSNPAILNLAENLFRYSFYRHGFKFGPTSFMHLCPTAVKTACPEYVQFLRNMTNEDWIKDNITYSDYYESPNELLIENRMPNNFRADGMKLYTGNFADQYIRNNMNNYKFVVQNIVPQLIRNNKKQQNNLSSIDFIGKNRFGKDVIKYTVTLTIPSYNQLTIQDKRLIKLVKYDDDGNEIGYELMPYFSVKIANELVYYKAEQSSSEGVATYHRVFPLGYPNQFIEYDLTASPDSMESIFWFQNWKGIKVKREIAEDTARRKQQPIDISKGNQNERNIYDEMINHAWQNDYVQEQQTVPQPMEESSLPFNEPRQSDTDEWDRAMFDNDSDSEEMKRLYNDVTQPIFVEDSSDNYRNRTIKNAKADATIAFAVDFNSAGEKLTKKTVLQLGKKYIPIDTNNPNITEELVNHIVNELNSVNARTLNIAGNGIYTIKGKYAQEQVDEYVYELLNRVLNHPNLINKIENIRSGGQTGYDEAGIKAAMRLGIENGILAPKGWKFRNINGVDISDEHAFKARFNYISTKSGIKIVSDISVDKDQMNKDNTCEPTA